MHSDHPTDEALVPLDGSERPPTGPMRASLTAHSDPSERVEATVQVRRKDAAAFDAKLADRVRRAEAGETVEPMTREELAESHGASREDLLAVVRYASQHDLQVVSQSAAERTVVLSGTAAAFRDAFGAQLHRGLYEGQSVRLRSGSLYVPASLQGVITGIFGLDNRPVAKPRLRRAAAPAPAAVSFRPDAVGRIYGFPNAGHRAQTIAFIELGGGYRRSDMRAFGKELGLPSARLVAVGVGRARNAPTGDVNGPDGEVVLDVQVAYANAPEAHLVVYFAENTDDGFLGALKAAIHDTLHRPDVVSISWGGSESSWTPQSLRAFDQACAEAAALGVTVLAASGDDGFTDGDPDGKPHVDFPASSPHVTACGGTRLTAGPDGRVTSEVTWNDLSWHGGAGGGGVSPFFPRPPWQSKAGVPLAGSFAGRGEPDVCGVADPETGYRVLVDGQHTVVGGTSAVAPLWAALVARLNSNLPSNLGFLNPVLYGLPTGFRDITLGTTGGSFRAGAGWDACTGLGSPDGKALLASLVARSHSKA